jgi:signal transduction histidine kinase
MTGIVLLFIAMTCAHAPRFRRPFRSLFTGDEVGFVVERGRESRAIAALRLQYEEHTRRAARVEERTRLARDLHDAVKQQLFAIQTSAATAQARFDTDAAGAQSAIEQVRVSARDAMTQDRTRPRSRWSASRYRATSARHATTRPGRCCGLVSPG